MERVQKVLGAAVTVLLACWAIYAFVFVIDKELSLFRYTLFVRKSYLSVYKIVSVDMIRKTILTIILLMLGGVCVVLNYLMIERNQFLKIGRLCFLASVVVATIWELETLFFIPKSDGILWNRLADCFYILLNLEIVSMILGETEQIWAGCVYMWLYLLGGVFLVLTGIFSPIKMLAALKVYAVLMIGTVGVVLIWILITREENPKERILYAGMGMFQTYECILVAWYKMDPLKSQHKHYQNEFSYILVIFCVGVFVREFWMYRTNIIYGRNAEGRIQRAASLKEENMNRVINRSFGLIDESSSLAASVLEQRKEGLTASQEMMLKKIQENTATLSGMIQTIRRYNSMIDHTYQKMKMNIGYKVVLDAAISMVTAGEAQVDGAVQYTPAAEDRMIYGDPYQIMLIHMDFLKIMLELKGSSSVHVCTHIVDAEVETCMTIRAEDGNYWSKIHALSKIINCERIQNSISRDDLASVMISKNILLQYHGEARAIYQHNEFRLIYTLPVVSESERENLLQKNRLKEREEIGTPMKKIVLISCVPEQIELISSYLNGENFKLVIINSGTEALEYIKYNHEIGAVIVGNIFIQMDLNELCRKIREQYSMIQLPVIGIFRKVFLTPQSETSLFPYLNEMLEEPFRKEELIWKLQNAIVLQKTAEETIRTRLDFWQSQINPHFVFNSINTIMPLCMENPQKAYALLGNFSDYLRGNIFETGLMKETTIADEMNLICAYLELERARFGEEKIRYEMQVDCDEDIHIIPLLIEPIVENSVKHGRNSRNSLHIWLDVFQEGEWVYIQVRDDGNGMTEERLGQVYQQKAGRSIGLSNIMERLAAYYHENLNIQTQIGEGTTVSFRIPVNAHGM